MHIIFHYHSKLVLSYQPPKRLSPNFDTIQQADIETASKLRDLAFVTTDQNVQRHKLFIEDEIEYEKIKTDTLIEQTQHNLDHDDEIIEIENARLKAEAEAARLKARTDNEAENAHLKAHTDNKVAHLKAHTDNEAARLKVRHDAKRMKCKADVVDN